MALIRKWFNMRIPDFLIKASGWNPKAVHIYAQLRSFWSCIMRCQIVLQMLKVHKV